MDLVLRPVRIASSKQAQQTYLNTVLLFTTSAVLLGLAAFAYILFYMSLPQIGIERVVHLQFGDGLNPYGFVSLGSSIVAQQSYDIVLELDLPRSPPNLLAGNFMLDMVLLSPIYQPVTQPTEAGFEMRRSMPNEAVLFSSRRPAILTYHPRLVSMSKQFAALPWYILGWHRDAEKLVIPMVEGVLFRKGWRNVPSLVYLELQGKGQGIEVYDVQLKLRARYEGIRWLMYNYRILSFIVFTTAFWFSEVTFAILAWILWNSRSHSMKEKGKGELKGEDTDASTAFKTEREDGEQETDDLDLSDTPRSFPTYGRQAPLQYLPKVKAENDSEELVMDETNLQPFAAEADDESEEPVDISSFRGGRSDSGLGTSFSEAGANLAGGVQRRRSRGGRGSCTLGQQMALHKCDLWHLVIHALLVAPCITDAAQEPLRGAGQGNGPFDEKFEKLANETLERWKCPGLSIAVVDGNDTWAAGYGIATFPDTPADASTLFMVGSTTKAFTAAAMSFLVDDNEHYPDIQWDTPISKIIRDDFVLEEDYFTTHVSIEDALSHRSGMPRHDLSYGGHYNSHYVTSKDVVRSLRYLPLTAELRTKAQYCNMMYVVASYVIETLTGSWLGDVIRTRILEPLDMKSTYFSAAAARKANEHFAQGYYYVNGTYYEAPDLELHQVSGAGFIISNVLDYTKWIRAWIDKAPPISKASHKAIRTPRTLFTESGDDFWTGPLAYSLGWFNTVYKGHEVYWHTGGMEAFGALVVILPDIRYGLVGFGNIATRSNSAEEVLIWHLVDERLGIEMDKRDNWDKKNRKRMEREKCFLDNAKSILFPNIPSPPLPLSLPLESYTGTYLHPAYRNMTVTLSSSPSGSSWLHIDRTDVTWKMFMDLEHVSGEHFLAWTDSLTAPRAVFNTALPVQFRLGVDGIVTEFGARLEEEMGNEKIWFKRI